MTERMSAAQYRAQAARPKSKYGAQAVVIDGFRFDSKLEGEYYLYLKARVASGEVVYFLRQVPFYFPGGVTYRCDFMVMEIKSYGQDALPKLRCRYIDVKGVETKEFKRSKKMVEALYPVEIEVVKKGEFR